MDFFCAIHLMLFYFVPVCSINISKNAANAPCGNCIIIVITIIVVESIKYIHGNKQHPF